jgi:hypothetical protein
VARTAAASSVRSRQGSARVREVEGAYPRGRGRSGAPGWESPPAPRTTDRKACAGRRGGGARCRRSMGSNYLKRRHHGVQFMQFLQAHLFTDFPDLRFIILHGGGAVPYHWGRLGGNMLGRQAIKESKMGNVLFDMQPRSPRWPRTPSPRQVQARRLAQRGPMADRRDAVKANADCLLRPVPRTRSPRSRQCHCPPTQRPSPGLGFHQWSAKR